MILTCGEILADLREDNDGVAVGPSLLAKTVTVCS